MPSGGRPYGIPTVPGPFSFLEGVGDVAGQYYSSKKTAEDQQFETLLALISGGLVGREQLATPQAQQMLARRGISGVQPKEPTAAELIDKERAAVLKDPTHPARQDVTSIPDRETAKKMRSLEQQRLDLELYSIEPQRMQMDLDRQIIETTQKLLDTDPELRKVASFARLGALSYLVQGQQNRDVLVQLEKQMGAERARLVTSVLSNSITSYSTAYDKWFQQAQLMERTLQLEGDEEEGKRKMYEWLQKYPAPQYEAALKSMLQSVGLTEADVKAAFKAVLNKETGSPGGAPTAAEPQPKSTSQKFDSATTARISAIIAKIRSGEVTREQVESDAKMPPEVLAEIRKRMGWQ